jgi:hypothetical protein
MGLLESAVCLRSFLSGFAGVSEFFYVDSTLGFLKSSVCLRSFLSGFAGVCFLST